MKVPTDASQADETRKADLWFILYKAITAFKSAFYT